MDNKESSVKFTKKQIEYLMNKTGTDDPQEAVEIFIGIIKDEKMDPLKMPLYINKIMEREAKAK